MGSDIVGKLPDEHTKGPPPGTTGEATRVTGNDTNCSVESIFVPLTLGEKAKKSVRSTKFTGKRSNKSITKKARWSRKKESGSKKSDTVDTVNNKAADPTSEPA